MRTLTTYHIDQIDHLIQPNEFADMSLKSPALHILNDFKTNPPAILDADTKALDALEMMKHEHSALKLVVDAKQEMVGILSTAELSSQNIMQHVSKDVKAADLSVGDLMRPRDNLMALSYQQLQYCTVGDVLNTLQHCGEAYCAVIDIEQHQIRGVISAREIASRLHIPPVDITRQPNFLNIFDRLYA